MSHRGKWDKRYAQRDLVWSAGPNQQFADIVSNLQPRSALDVACGEGRNAIWLAERGWQATAVDFSAEAVEKARQIAERRGVTIGAEVADLTQYEPTPGGYDLVVIAYLQLVDAELTPILRRAADAVSPGGRLVLVSHDLTNLESGHGGPQHPAVLTSPEQVVAAVGEALTIELAEIAERRVQTDDGEKTALDTVVVASRPV